MTKQQRRFSLTVAAVLVIMCGAVGYTWLNHDGEIPSHVIPALVIFGGGLPLLLVGLVVTSEKLPR